MNGPRKKSNWDLSDAEFSRVLAENPPACRDQVEALCAAMPESRLARNWKRFARR